MSKSDTPTQERIAPDHDRGSIDTPRVGVDDEGRTHYYDDDSDAVIVVAEDGTLIDEVPLRGNSLAAYRTKMAKLNETEWVVTGSKQLAEGVARVGGLH